VGFEKQKADSLREWQPRKQRQQQCFRFPLQRQEAVRREPRRAGWQGDGAGFCGSHPFRKECGKGWGIYFRGDANEKQIPL